MSLKFKNLSFTSNEEIMIGNEFESRITSNGLFEEFQFPAFKITKEINDLQGSEKFRNENISKGLGNNFAIQTIFCLDFDIERNFNNCFHNLELKMRLIYIKENFSDRTGIYRRILGEPWYPRQEHLGTEIDSNHFSYAYRTL